MAKKQKRGGGRDLQSRLMALGGLVVIVGGVALVLFFAGVLGGQGGGTTEAGIEIEDAELVETPRPAGAADLEVEAKEGALAPDFVLSDFDGARHRLSDFRGTTVYVNFWATWCIPCQRELPDVQELADRHTDDLVVITVNRAQRVGKAKDFFAKLENLNGKPGLDFTVNGLDPNQKLYRTYTPFPGAMPVSYFIDANGKVVRVYTGLIDLEIMEQAVAEAMQSAQA